MSPEATAPSQVTPSQVIPGESDLTGLTGLTGENGSQSVQSVQSDKPPRERSHWTDPAVAVEPMALVQAAQAAVARALTEARGDDHSRLLRAGTHLVRAGQALDARYATNAGTRRRRTP